MDICSKISSFFHDCLPPNTNISSFFYACLAPNTSAVIVRNSDMDKSIHNDVNECECDCEQPFTCKKNNELNLSEVSKRLEEVLEIFQNVDHDDEETNSGKFSLI
jgi:hypothetical protein